MRNRYVLVLALSLWACQSYKYADKVKMVAFDDDFKKGKSIGNVRGEDCQTWILGYPLGPSPKLDRAVEHLQRQTEGKTVDVTTDERNKESRLAVRYINDVSTNWDSFSAVLFGKNCLIVKGRGYK